MVTDIVKLQIVKVEPPPIVCNITLYIRLAMHPNGDGCVDFHCSRHADDTPSKSERGF